MALNFSSSGLPKRRDHPPPLGKTSNDPLTVRPPKLTSPDQHPWEGTCVPFAIRRVFMDGASAPSVFCSVGNIVLQMEFIIVPPSKSPSTHDGIPFSPFSSTGCINGSVLVSKFSSSVV